MILKETITTLVDKYKERGLTDDDINNRLEKLINKEKIEIVNSMIEKEELEKKLERLECHIKHQVRIIDEAEKYIKERTSQ